jgi:hypothetical protein
MANEGYLPRADKARALWLTTFATKFTLFGATLGFSQEEITAVQNDAAMFRHVIDQVAAYNTAKEARIAYKNMMRDGRAGTNRPVRPAPIVEAEEPAQVQPGIFPRIAKLVQRIKYSTAYTEPIGKDLGIVAAAATLDRTALQPTLRLVRKADAVEVQWKKGKANGLHIEVDRGQGVWQFLAVDTIPHYTDKAPITGPATWRYRAMYLIKDTPTGQWSNVTSITVG